MQNKLLVFTASWCRPCKRLKKTIDNLPDEEIHVYDFDQSKDAVVHWGVEVVPTIILVNHKGQELRRLLGNQPREKLLELLHE